MYLKKFYVDNFRGYRKFTINCNNNTNILTGVNNSGKTTILEAISLWNEIFNHLIVKAGRSETSSGIRKGEYRLGKKGQNYLDYREINSVRGFGYRDIFFDLNTSSEIEISATFQLTPTSEITIPFFIKEANGNNYNVFLKNHDSFNFRLFNDSFTTLPDIIGCYFSSPIATISSYEEFATNPKIKNGIKNRESVRYFRNRLHNLSKGDSFDDFKLQLSNILYGESNKIDFNIIGDKSKDINISIEVSLKGSRFKNISLLGSGTIQVMEILLHLFETQKSINIILLDEPDSHIHRDIQKRLLKFLKSSSTQVFLTTHNESLIRSANPNNIFFIDESVSSFDDVNVKPIGKENLPQRKIGIEHSHHSKLINKIGSETSLDILNALEADKILFVEGTDDSTYIQKLLEINSTDTSCVFWSFGGLDNLISKIKHYKEFFVSLGCNQSIWDKCSVIIDADFMTDNQKNNLKLTLNNKLSIPIFIWSSYTIESTILTKIDILEQIITRICSIQEVAKSSTDIATSINNAIIAVRDSKKHQLNEEPDLCKRIVNQMETRINNLKNNLDINRKRIFEDITIPNLSNEYRIFSNGKLSANEISHISSKEDVEQILEQIFDELGLIKDTDFENHFSYVLNSIDSFSFNQEWKDLINFIAN